jgi:hypothetical protein
MTCDHSREKSHAVGLLLRPLGGCVHERGHDLTLVSLGERRVDAIGHVKLNAIRKDVEIDELGERHVNRLSTPHVDGAPVGDGEESRVCHLKLSSYLHHCDPDATHSVSSAGLPDADAEIAVFTPVLLERLPSSGSR